MDFSNKEIYNYIDNHSSSSGIASSASSMSALSLCIMSLEKKLTLVDDDYFFKKASFISRIGSGSASKKMFESRLFFVDKLIDMGAKIILCDPHRATVIGHDFKSSLKATSMSSPDIRAGISLLIAALSAKGVSVIQNIEQIDRGYENIDERLKALGASIERI